MHILDYIIFAIYMLGIMYIGFYFYKKNKDVDDYYVGSRKMSPFQIGLSVVATDVGGGFSIGLGGLGFIMGISGSWLLFTGLIGAWMAAIMLIPKVKKLENTHKMLTYPDFIKIKYNDKVAIIAALISAIGYLGFTGAQALAGATLAQATIITSAPFGLTPFAFSLIIVSIVIIIYTSLGGLKAVVFTDSIQWTVILIGFIISIPFALRATGGFSGLRETLPPEFFSFTNIEISEFINWMVTIIPIWFVAMTLFQRIYACQKTKDAQKAWFFAGVLEFPLLALLGAFLGLCARALFPEIPVEQAEMGLPMLISTVLPIGIAGIIVSAYFSAIMSTADSCLMASSGNILNDFMLKYSKKTYCSKSHIKTSQIVTFVIGIIAVLIATLFETVLEIILYTYAFLVSGLLIPTLGALYLKKRSAKAAIAAMLGGGSLTVLLMTMGTDLPYGLDPNVFGLLFSAILFFGINYIDINILKNASAGEQ